MDLLNSILNAMDKPPSANDEQKKAMKKQRELEERIKNKQKEELSRFRKYAQDRIERFSKDDRPYIEFQPLDKVHRAIIHDIAEFGGFLAMSFGREDVDRHSVVYKKENAPSEDEVAARRNGDGWNEEIAKEYGERRKQLREIEIEQKKQARASPSTANTTADTNNASIDAANKKPTTFYKDKYAHLIGQEAALGAARKTEANVSYGFVSSKNKKDIRSIEQTLADIRDKKRRRLQQQQEEEELQQSQPHHKEDSQQSVTSIPVQNLHQQPDPNLFVITQPTEVVTNEVR